MSLNRNIDDIINGITPSPPDEKYIKKEAEPAALNNDVIEDETPPELGDEVVESDYKPETPKVEKKEEPEEQKAEAENVDEYGNEIPKPRTFTEDEVQRMIRDRLRETRGRIPGTNQPPQDAMNNSQDNENSGKEQWEIDLEKIVANTIDKRQKESHTKAWQEQEEQRQIEFEGKFSSGMARYSDFKNVVGAMPITDAIMVATREMKDPAAFLYAASKVQPDELKRIASLPNPIHQATEIGRLEERMKKAARISKAPKPLAPTRGEPNVKIESPKQSIEDKIHQHGKNRVR